MIIKISQDNVVVNDAEDFGEFDPTLKKKKKKKAAGFVDGEGDEGAGGSDEDGEFLTD